MKWREKRLKVIFGQVATGGHFVKKNVKQNKVEYWSEMTRNVIESDFWSSKMAAGGHFVIFFKKLHMTYLCTTWHVYFI